MDCITDMRAECWHRQKRRCFTANHVNLRSPSLMHTVFPFDNGPAADVCREFFDRDLANARLTPSFRAYYLLRPLIPLFVRQFSQRRRNRRIHAATNWYLPQEFCQRLARALEVEGAEGLPPWPEDATFAFVLTHDVESAYGLKHIHAICAIEEEFGFHSSWNIVPYKYRIDQGVIDDLRQRGCEIGIHGYNHDGKLFWSEATFRQRVPAINAAIERYRAVGFRAPMAHRNLRWMQQLNITYDSSCFDIDPFQAMPGGIGSLWPIIAGRFVELPYTLPQDHTLFVGLGETSDRIWVNKLSLIRRFGGMALMLTHPDYLDTPRRRGLYRDFLAKVRDGGGYWHALPHDVALWWRARREHAPHEITGERGSRRSAKVC